VKKWLPWSFCFHAFDQIPATINSHGGYL
jgi:hypothetical protein